MAGNATFLRLPQLIEAQESAAGAGKPRIRLDLTGVTHLDHACRNQVEEFAAQQRGLGLRVELLMPGPGPDTTGQPTRTTEPLPRRSVAAPETAPAAPAESAPVPGPTAEWFCLDTRPLPEEYATQPPLVR